MKVIVIVIIILSILFIAIICDIVAEEEMKEKYIIYNNGIHKNCGEWQLITILQDNNSNTIYYYYECTKCHKILKSKQCLNDIKMEVRK